MRIVIFRNTYGSYGLQWEAYVPKDDNPDPEDERPFGNLWVPKHPVTFCDSFETARREAQRRLFLKRLPILLLRLVMGSILVGLILGLGIPFPKVRIVKCPACKSTDFIPIGHGLPLSQAIEKANRGDFGGRVAFKDAPNWECRNCRTQFS
jgi:hypothetical protein